MKEVWKDIPSCPGYQVSDLGRIKATAAIPHRWRKGERILKPNKHQYYGCRIRLIGVPNPKTRSVGAYVLEAFIGPRPTGLECCHNDGNPTNNVLSNLRWDTHRSNANDMMRHGRNQHMKMLWKKRWPKGEGANA